MTPIAAPAAGLDLWQATVLGFIQGMTEFIPISSSGHLRVVPELLGWGDPGEAFTAVIQLGSLFAVFWYFRKDLLQLSQGSLAALRKRDWQNHDLRVSLGIGLGTIPICVVGLAVKLFFKAEYQALRSNLLTVGITSIVLSLLLLLAEKLAKHERTFGQTTFADCLAIGSAQVLALVPGVSRSGATITTSLFLGIKRSDAARFSFLLGLPAIFIAGAAEFKDVVEAGRQFPPLSLAVALLSSAVFSYLSIAWMVRYLQRHGMWIFIAYRLAFGAFLIAWVCR